MIVLLALVAITLILVLGALTAQEYHYAFLREEREDHHFEGLSADLQAKFKELEEIKKKVDALVLKNGFKL